MRLSKFIKHKVAEIKLKYKKLQGQLKRKMKYCRIEKGREGKRRGNKANRAKKKGMGMKERI